MAIKRRTTLEYEDGAFMREARGYCMTADYANMYTAIDRRIIYGDEVRIDPMSMVTSLGSSEPNLFVNSPMPRQEKNNPGIYHHAELVQVVE